MFIIGITGATGAGKSTALRAAGALGALTLDCDEIYHDLLERDESLKAEIAANFPGALKDGDISREALGKIVFNNPSALQALNGIARRHVGDEVSRRLSIWESRGGKLAAIDAIALIESGESKRCDVVVGISAPKEQRAKRIMERDSITREQADRRIAAQQPDSFYEDRCDFMLDGSLGSPMQFEESCKAIFAELIK